ncbi:MAG: SAM-dependent methyltransferase [Alphaproteobacteria bacterium]|nr:SAM-dependent methyltransferase [Alphaproteobacteria bacterium]
MAGEFKLEDVLPWGRNRAEYQAFFDLGNLASDVKMLDCASGPSSFNAEMTASGYQVVSADPIYQFSADDIAGRVQHTRTKMLAGLRAAQDRFVFTWHKSIERHDEIRMAAMHRFLGDFEAGKDEARYEAAALPNLPFADGAFDIALCSHFLFLYSNHLDATEHTACIEEMMRASTEARIFPLLDLDGKSSRHVDPVRRALEKRGFESALQRVNYEFQKGGHTMLRVMKP